MTLIKEQSTFLGINIWIIYIIDKYIGYKKTETFFEVVSTDQ